VTGDGDAMGESDELDTGEGLPSGPVM